MYRTISHETHRNKKVSYRKDEHAMHPIALYTMDDLKNFEFLSE